MFLLKKLFNLRQLDEGEDEKPFLEHLDDLRSTITKIVLTLLIGTILGWAFREDLMSVIRRPIDQVWESQQAQTLPKSVTPDQWEDAKVDALAVAGLDGDSRENFLTLLGEERRFNAETLLYYRALLQLPEEARDTFIDGLPAVDAALRDQLAALQAGNPNASLDASRKVKLMGAFKPTETFMLSMKLAFFAALVVTFPLLLLFILEFTLPALKENERRALWPAMAIGFGLFLFGVTFCYFFVLPNVLEFFFTFSEGMQVENDWRIGYYITFATRLTLIFGLAFELPVVVMTLVKIGLLDAQTMRNTRSYAVLAIFIAAAVITPTPDAPTLMLLAVPMYVLYEICIWLAVLLEKKARKREEEEEKEYMERMLASGGSAAAVAVSDSDAPSSDPANDADTSDDDELPPEEQERLERLLSPPAEAVGSDDPYAIANPTDDENSDEMDDGEIDEDLLDDLDSDEPDDEIPEEERDRR